MYSKPEIAPVKKAVKPKHYPKDPKKKGLGPRSPNPKSY